MLITLLLLTVSIFPAEGETLRLHIDTIDARSLDVEFIAILDGNSLRYRNDDKEKVILLRDVMRITPDAKRPSSSSPEVQTKNIQLYYLTDGGLLRGRMIAGDKAIHHALRVGWGPDQESTIPFKALAAVRTASRENAEAELEFQKRLSLQATGRDTMIVVRDQKPVVVTGSLEALGPEKWVFRFGSRIQSAGIEKVYGFVLSATPESATPLPATIRLVNGDHFSARIHSADRQSLMIQSHLLGSVTLPWHAISKIDLRSDRIVYLSDLEPSRVDQRSFLSLSWPYRRDKNVSGGSIRLSGRCYAKGLGVHSYSALTYQLNGEYELFSAIIGIDDSVAPDGSVVFRVRTGDRVVYSSPIIRGNQKPETISIDVRGAKTLTLECDVGPDLDLSDHADWVNPFIVRAKGAAAQ